MRLGLLTLIISALFTLMACEKDITADFGQNEQYYVVEGHIENGLPPYVILSYSQNAFAKFDTSSYAKSLVRGAEIWVIDGQDSVKLQEFQYPPFIVYSSLGGFVGKAGHTYRLRIKTNGNLITASTKLLTPIGMDSIKFVESKFTKGYGLIKCFFTDPDSLGNYYRFFSKRLGKDPVDLYLTYTKQFGSVFDDKVINGQHFDFDIARGTMPGEDFSKDPNFPLFQKGDTVIFKWTSIDSDSYNFWRSAEQAMNSYDNPFGVPPFVKGNVNGAKGIWGAYAAVYDTIIAR